MPKLHEITGSLIQIENMMDDPEAGEQQILDAIETMDGALKEKAVSIVMLVQNLESASDAIKAAETRMSERRRVIDNRTRAIKDYVLKCMQASGIMKIECPEFKISIRNNPQKVVIEDEKLVPIFYLRQPEIPPPQPDKKLIASDIKQGVIVDGCHLEQGQSLSIS